MAKSENCVDIVRPFVREVAGREDVQLIGGIGSRALQDSRTIIVPSEKRVIAPADLALPNYRDDGNKRDCDILVLSPEQSEIDAVEAAANKAIGDKLDLEVFGLKPLARLREYSARPRRAAFLRFVSDRYVEMGSDHKLVAMKALFPFMAPMDPETLETWSLFIGDRDPNPAPIPHPGGSILNYLTRSISGLRPKDETKVAAMADNVFSQVPEMHDWLADGPGKTQFELARILQTMSRPGTLTLGQLLEVEPLPEPIYEHDAFMLRQASHSTKFDVVMWSQAKARVLHAFESSPKIVTLWQRLAERHVDTIVHND